MVAFGFLNSLRSKMESHYLFTLCYVFFSICLVFPPQEFVSAGLTVECVVSFWIKKARYYVLYHIRRTIVNLIVHSCIPLGYVLGLKYVSPDNPIWEKNILLDFFVVISFAIPIITFFTVIRWYETKFINHPIVKNLRHFRNDGKSVMSIITDIDNEYRSINKIIIKCSSLTKVVVTDNWIMRIRPYSINIIHQSDASLIVSSCDSHFSAPNRSQGNQYLTIDVKSSRPEVNSFKIRINSADFKDLQDKMLRPINIMENIHIHGSLTDCFLNVFKKHIRQNPKVSAPENLDVCIGCFLAKPNVKLMTSCGYTTGEKKCTMCCCRPLWCEDCMGKWFASRQNQEKPDTWLSSKATCPMCRSTFCLLDVCLLDPSYDYLRKNGMNDSTAGTFN